MHSVSKWRSKIENYLNFNFKILVSCEFEAFALSIILTDLDCIS